MQRVAIVTARYPFGVGEEFLEAELAAWAAADAEVVLLPERISGERRPTPPEVRVDDALAGPRTWSWPFRWGIDLALAVLSPAVFLDLWVMLRQGRVSVRGIAEVFVTAGRVRRMGRLIARASRDSGPFDCIYTYWNGAATFAATRLAADPLVISRAHGGDLYEFRRGSGNHPLKRYYGRRVDATFAVSEHGRDHLAATYGVPAERLAVGRLGVDLPTRLAGPTPPGHFHLVSVSSVIPVKRVGAILDAAALLAARDPALDVTWTHIGDGAGLPELVAAGARLEAEHPRLRVELLGRRSHGEVVDYLATSEIDVFVNASSSEGVPVSIMEALAAGVPCVAPRIGGIAELVDSSCGRLVPPAPSSDELSAALAELVSLAKEPGVRHHARTVAEDLACASSNYDEFVARVLTLLRGGDRA